MSIRQLARELYRKHREVERLEAGIDAAPPSGRDDLREQLRKARGEWRRLRNILDGEKITAPPKKRFR